MHDTKKSVPSSMRIDSLPWALIATTLLGAYAIFVETITPPKSLAAKIAEVVLVLVLTTVAITVSLVQQRRQHRSDAVLHELIAGIAASTGAATSSSLARKLNEWQIGRLIAILLPHAGQRVTILASRGDETLEYARQFRQVLRTSGWRVVGPTAAPTSQPALDIQLSINAEYFSATGLPGPFLALRSGIDFTGLKSRPMFVLDPNVPRTDVVLWIGARSDDQMHPQNYLPLAVGPKSLAPFEAILNYITKKLSSWKKKKAPDGSSE